MDSGKSKGGGLCMYVLNDWCSQSRIIESHCSPDIESMTVIFRPFYLPRELTVVVVTAVYIPPDAKISSALTYLHIIISKHQRAYPDGVHIIAGDFNQACLKTVLPKFSQYVKCATRGSNTLDRVYSNIKHGYRAVPLPHLGLSDHVSLFLVPAYTPLRKRMNPTTKTIKTWPEGALFQLQDCFARTRWGLFKHQDVAEYTQTVLFYIASCTDIVTEEKYIRVFPNQKPWMTPEVHTLLRARDMALKSGERALYSAARGNLKRGIKTAKLAYKRRIEEHFTGNNTRRVWQGVQHITNFKGSATTGSNSSASLAEELNCFFARFDKKSPLQHTSLPVTGTQSLTLQEYEVRQVFRSVNPRKAAGPDGVLGKVLKACAYELAAVFTDIFNQSLSQAIVPACLKSAIIIPVPKKPAVDSLNDYRPIALTSVVAKCLERLVLRHIKASLPLTFDPNQFAYRANRSTEDAIATALHKALEHLEHRGTYIRMLFIDYSSAFNSIILDILIRKLLHLGFSAHLCNWIMDFLTNHPQCVKLGIHRSSSLTLSTVSPQGCVLSPLLYCLYTFDCTSTHFSNHIIKFADDTTVIGLISGNEESAYRDEVGKLMLWCSENNLVLNTKKTKELIVDF